MEEANIISSTGQFSLKYGGVELKYFAQSLEDAHWYGKMLYPDGYTIFQGSFKGSLDQYWFPGIDIGAYVVPTEVLPAIVPHL